MILINTFNITMAVDKNQIYTTEEVAKILKVSPVTIKRYIAENKIPSIKFNGLRRFKGEDLLKILKSKKYDKKLASDNSKYRLP